jgi:membrane-associated phospholipid phosphatase
VVTDTIVTADVTRRGGARRRWQLALGGALIVAFVTTSAIFGLPQSTDRVSLWVLGALLVLALGQPHGWTKALVDFLPLVALLLLYDFLRAQAKGLVGHVFTFPQIRVDEFLFGGTVPTVTLQRALYTPGHPHVWDYAAFLVYLSYFFVPLTLALLVWKLRHQDFRRYVFLWISLCFAAFITYALYPASPPWMASLQGHIQHMTRINVVISQKLGVDASRLMGSQHFVNRVAAVPSLHVATPVLIALFFWPISSRRRRWALVAWPLAMGFSLVYLGEHYVFDILLGALYAVAVYVFGNRIWDRWHARSRAT